MADEEQPGPSALVSYAQSDRDWGPDQTTAWRDTVYEFAIQLCRMGIDAEVDRFHAHDQSVDWNRWGPQQARETDFVLIAVSAAYKERWEGDNAPTQGAGAVREANELHGQFNQNQEVFRRRVKVVILPSASAADVPAELSGLQRFDIPEVSQEGLIDLYRTLTDQPATPKPELGPLLILDQREEEPIAEEETASLREDLDRIGDTLSQVPEEDLMQAELGHLSLPWVRTVRQLMTQEQAILARLIELGAGGGGPT